MNTPMQILFEKYGHLLPDVSKEFLEKERQMVIDANENSSDFTSGAEYFKLTYKNKQDEDNRRTNTQ